MLRNQPALQEYDPLLLWSALALLMMGLVMVYSASIATAEGSKFTGHQASYFLVRHRPRSSWHWMCWPSTVRPSCC